MPGVPLPTRSSCSLRIGVPPPKPFDQCLWHAGGTDQGGFGGAKALGGEGAGGPEGRGLALTCGLLVLGA
eukprot:12821047-Alexandrium_andersonii.AAC.1